MILPFVIPRTDNTTGPVFREHPHRRRNLAAWREARARRLAYLESRGYATPRQLARLRQLDLRSPQL